jgi:hypothetical protein
MHKNANFREVIQEYQSVYFSLKAKGYTELDAMRIANTAADERYSSLRGKRFCIKEESRDKIQLKKAIVDLLEVRPEGISFLDLTDIKRFSGYISLAIDIPAPFRHKNIFAWTHCSELAVQCMVDLTGDMVISIVPIEDTAQAIRIYKDGLKPNLIMYEFGLHWVTNQPSWMPCIVNKNVAFEDYAKEIHNHFGDLAC